MAQPLSFPEEVTIVKADYSLKQKLGSGNLDTLFSPNVVKNAEAIIADASHDFYMDCISQAVALQALSGLLKGDAPRVMSTLKEIIAVAFELKAKSGQAGYQLIASLAKSLQLLCEGISIVELTPQMLAVIDWHVKSLRRLLEQKVRGDGGPLGAAILEEVKKLNR